MELNSTVCIYKIWRTRYFVYSFFIMKFANFPVCAIIFRAVLFMFNVSVEKNYFLMKK